MGALETNTTLIYGIHLRESADDGSDFSNAAADYRVLFLGEDGFLHVKDSSGTVTDAYENSGASLGAWTDYTPTWTATTTNPTLGSTTIAGRYKELDSKTLAVRINIAITTGGAWNAGSGSYIFSLPAGKTAHASALQILSAHVLDNGTAHFAGIARVLGGGTTIAETVIADSSGSRLLSNTVPVTWATGDQINISGIIEIQ